MVYKSEFIGIVLNVTNAIKLLVIDLITQIKL